MLWERDDVPHFSKPANTSKSGIDGPLNASKGQNLNATGSNGPTPRSIHLMHCLVGDEARTAEPARGTETRRLEKIANARPVGSVA